VWAIVWFRFGQYLQTEAPRILCYVSYIPYKVIERVLQWMVGIHLHPSCRIGPGLYIGHYGGIWINPRATIGANCNISHEVTIGAVKQTPEAAPALGDRVWVGPNATISGPVRIGSGAVIGANSLVVADVPENGVAIGVPARLVGDSGSARLLNLPEA
jgi:serine O-acetyltransferase